MPHLSCTNGTQINCNLKRPTTLIWWRTKLCLTIVASSAKRIQPVRFQMEQGGRYNFSTVSKHRLRHKPHAHETRSLSDISKSVWTPWSSVTHNPSREANLSCLWRQGVMGCTYPRQYQVKMGEVEKFLLAAVNTPRPLTPYQGQVDYFELQAFGDASTNGV